MRGVAGSGEGGSGRGATAVGILFAGTIGWSAALLFAVQPLVAKLLLPGLGGSAIVWAATSLFFQLTLLAGYGLAHVATARLGPRRQALLIVLLVLSALPFAPAAPLAAAPLREGDRALPWLLAHLGRTVGVPALAFATLGPSLQRWFAEHSSRNAGDPFRLYVASNAGSLLALLAYPLVIEPWLSLGAQRTAFRAGLGVLAVGVVACAATLGRAESSQPAAAASPIPRPTMSWAARLRWCGLAFVPASLSLAITTHVTTDLAPVPLLWVTPLAIYLCTFIVAFTDRGPEVARRLAPLLPLACLPLVPLLGLGLATPLAPVLGVHLGVLAVTGLVFHGALSRTRPAPSALTDFYLWLALGGALGALFNAVVAPLLLRRALEYPLTVFGALVALTWVLRALDEEPHARGLDRRVAVGSATLTGLALLVMLLVRADDPIRGTAIRFAPFALMVIPFGLGYRWPRAAGAAVALLLAGSLAAANGARPVVHIERSLFSTYVVGEHPRLRLRYLAHGRTIHGVESLDRELQGWALPYWPPESPAAQLLEATAERQGSRTAVLGLGVGALSVFADPDGEMVFYELDATMARIATEHFGYLERCGGPCRVEVADGRSGLAGDPWQYDLIVLDAFSSSAIPVHLLTLEAMRTYLGRLRPGGVILVHVTNHYIDLDGPLGAAAAELGLVARARPYEPPADQAPDHALLAGSRWVVLAPDERALERAGAAGPAWRALEPDARIRAWTDDYANPLAAYRW